MRYYLDTEFNEDGHTIDLISIAIVTERIPTTTGTYSDSFYAVSTEARLDLVNPWVREHVLPQLPRYGDPAWKTRADIRAGIEEFIKRTSIAAHGAGPGEYVPRPEHVEFWAYYADYDWVAFCQLFGTMMDLPEHFPKFCRDLKQLSVDVGSPKHPPSPKGEHNALVDAHWNRELHDMLVEMLVKVPK